MACFAGAPDRQNDHCTNDGSYEPSTFISAIPAKRLAEKGRNERSDHAKDGRENQLGNYAGESGNEALEGENVAFRLDVNLDPRSTNHAHVDFWMAETGKGQRANGPLYSINVIDGEKVWVYRPGAPGQVLGTIDQCEGKKIQDLLQMAAEEFGEQLWETAAQ